LFSLFLIHHLRRPAVNLGLVDIPGGRKAHDGHVPLVGGVGVFAAFSLVALLLPQDLGLYRGLFFGMGILLIAGILDDLHDLRARGKLVIQVIAAVVLVLWGGHSVPHLGQWPGADPLSLGLLAVPFSILCVVGFVNAVNMLDGVDGLAGGVVLVMLAWLMAAAYLVGHPEKALLPALLAAAVAAFLLFNFPHPWRRCASVFMGDAGSLLLGFAVAWFAVDLASSAADELPPMTIAWILALPVLDALTLMARRLHKGQNPMTPDREHLHHIFQRAGFSIRGTVYILLTLVFLMGGVGMAGWWAGVPDWLMFAALLVFFAGHVYFVLHAWRMVRSMRWVRERSKARKLRAGREGNA
jgi:UDP-GlcNAc:undecaprenyl-phosphate GlcNAc-1-phosphate transferase